MIFDTGAASTDKPFVLYDNRLAAGVLSTVGGLASGAAAENVLGPQTYDFWQPGTAPGALICTLPAAETWDAIGIAAHNLHKMGAGLFLHTCPDLVSAWSTVRYLGAAELLANGAASIAVLFADRSVRRFQILGEVGSAPYAQIGVAYTGKRTIIPADVQPPYVPINEAQRVEFTASISMGGHFLNSTVQRQGLVQDVQFSGVPRGFVDGALRGFSAHYREGGTFFWAGSPSYMPADIGYCWRGDGGELRPAYGGGGRYADLKMGVAGYGA